MRRGPLRRLLHCWLHCHMAPRPQRSSGARLAWLCGGDRRRRRIRSSRTVCKRYEGGEAARVGRRARGRTGRCRCALALPVRRAIGRGRRCEGGGKQQASPHEKKANPPAGNPCILHFLHFTAASPMSEVSRVDRKFASVFYSDGKTPPAGDELGVLGEPSTFFTSPLRSMRASDSPCTRL